MMFPPIGFFGSAVNMAAPSTWATTWFVITTATPNYNTTLHGNWVPAASVRMINTVHSICRLSDLETTLYIRKFVSQNTTKININLFSFVHIARMPDKTDAKKVLTASPLENWRRLPGRASTKWMKTIQQDLKSNNLSLNEAIDMAQNRPLWTLETDFYVWCYALLVVMMMMMASCRWHSTDLIGKTKKHA